ncbi:MAG: class D sortase [Acidobacteriaceae bacterium]|nr:class D sortase [Acidobacteriaceae bacterium]
MKRRVELALLLSGVLLLGSSGWKLLKYEVVQHHPGWYSQLTVPTLPGAPAYFRLLRASRATPRIIGRLYIPRLEVSVLVVDGAEEDSLELGAWHVPGTASIGGAGNTVIAGHRDTTFRALRKVRSGDFIRIEPGETYSYIVDTLRVVDPGDIRVLQSDGSSTLTLITCYPFQFIGDAPKRYVIQAKKAS